METLRKVPTDGADEMTAFNQLTDAEAERLALLAEECGEAIKAIMKILRHGYESRNPDEEDGDTNREALERELGDVGYAVTLMTTSGDLRIANIDAARMRKAVKVKRYLHHQRLGQLTVPAE